MALNQLPDLSSRQLRAVLAVAEYRSFIAAAAFLKVSQPALTRTIKQIEKEVGVELFSRTTRQVSTTPAGKDFVALAERVLGDLQLGISSLQKHNEHQRGRIAVSSVLSLASESFASLLLQYRTQFPGMDIQLREGMQDNILDDVRSGAADVGIGYTNDLPEYFLAEAIGVEALHVVFPIKNTLAKQKKIAITELRDAPIVSYPVDARTRRLVDSTAATSKFALRHVATVNRLSTLMNLVRNDVGFAIVPSSERPLPNDRQLTSRPLVGTPISRIGMLRLRDRELNTAMLALVASIKEWIRESAPSRLRNAKRSSGRR